MSDSLFWALIAEWILVCSSGYKSTVTATLDSQAQDAIEDEYADTIRFPSMTFHVLLRVFIG
jgi:hypothetical protein